MISLRLKAGLVSPKFCRFVTHRSFASAKNDDIKLERAELEFE